MKDFYHVPITLCIKKIIKLKIVFKFFRDICIEEFKKFLMIYQQFKCQLERLLKYNITNICCYDYYKMFFSTIIHC